MDRGQTRASGAEVAFPSTIGIGELTLDIESITRKGRWIEAAQEFRGVAGTAWLRFPCSRPVILPRWPWLPFEPWLPFDHRLGRGLAPAPAADRPAFTQQLEVVARVVNPQTEIAFADAQRFRPDVQLGETVEIEVPPGRLQDILTLGTGVTDWLDGDRGKGDVLVAFEAKALRLEAKGDLGGWIVAGTAHYPAKPRVPAEIRVDVDGFELVITDLTVTPAGTTGAVTVRLPDCLSDPATCDRVTLDLGVVGLTPDCELYVDAPGQAYGPWLVGDTGLEIEGTGYTLDLSTTQSPSGRPASWRGMELGAGTATGARSVPDPCNTGYLRGSYSHGGAVLTGAGLDSTFILSAPITFEAIEPRGHLVTLDSGWLGVTGCRIVGGEFAPGLVKLPTDAVCAGAPGVPVEVGIAAASVQPDLDLAGVLDTGGAKMSWGELTHHGDELIAWQASVMDGYLFLPAGPRQSYCPESGGTFSGPAVSWVVDATLTELEAKGVSGVTVARLEDVLLFSPDVPGGVARPIQMPNLQGWLRVGHLGVDGELSTYQGLNRQKLGEPARTGYVGVVPFEADLFANDKHNLVAQLVTSAVFDSDLAARFKIPPPCDIKALDVARLQVTSTGHLVGGDVVLPPGGVRLTGWELTLVPTGTTPNAGVVSVRTGRIVFLAAGIAEPRHFAAPFSLTWGEMLANGRLGELFLDHNDYGQRFDGLIFHPREFLLSDVAPAVADPYLATAGAICFPFFGMHTVDIRDAIGNAAAPYLGRNVTVPKAALGPGWETTELSLEGTWKDIISADLATFVCPDVQVDYNVASQDGFTGTGSAEFGFLHSDGLAITVDIHGGATDIRISAADTHDIDVGLYARLSGVTDIAGCARIEGPLLTRIALYGILEQSAQAGAILGPKVGYAVEIEMSVTPTTFDFYASGDMLMSVGGVDVELSAMVHLLVDWAMASAEGELIGRIDCDAIIAGLRGEGQVTWHVDPAMQYLQGRVRVEVCSWVSGGLEGGFFVGSNVPRNLAWVLQPTNPHFGITTGILPATLTGVFGYGQLAFAFNVAVLGGGIELYAAMGAFTAGPPGLLTAFAGAGLPYVVGALGVYVHGEILGGLVSASAWANLAIRGPQPVYFDGTIGLEGCVAWVICGSVTLNAGLDSTGFYLR
jgi:hypothetical protein